MLSPTNLPIILWPLTPAVCVTLRSVPRWKSLKPSGPPIWMLVWWLSDRISVCMNRCARWSGRWVHGQLSDLHYVSAICRHHVGSQGNVIQQGHEFTTVAAWGPCLAAVIGVTHSKSDRFFLFIFFFVHWAEERVDTHKRDRLLTSRCHTASLVSHAVPSLCTSLNTNRHSAYVKSSIQGDPCLDTPQRPDQMSECSHCQASF